MISTKGLGADASERPLIPFQLIFDMDAAIINLIHDKYNDSSVFCDNILNHMNLLNWINLLLLRFDPNPISILSEDEELCSQVYKDIYATKGKELYKYQYKTNVFKLVHLLQIAPGMLPTILCKNEYEKQIILQYKKELGDRIIISEDLSSIDLDTFDAIFVKDIRDLLEFKKLNSKNIYIANEMFNFDPETEEVQLIDSIISKYKGKNIIKIFDIYTEEIKKYNPLC